MKNKSNQPASHHYFTISFIILLLFSVSLHATNHVIHFGGTLGFVYSPDHLDVAVGDSVTWEGSFLSHPLSSTSVPPGAAAFSKGSGDSFSYLVEVAGTYNYQCDAHFNLGMIGSFTATVTSVEGNVVSAQPAIFSLEQNYPNPFNPSTTIRYQLPVSGEVELSVYNLLGKRIETLVSDWQPAGRHQIQWQAGENASGIYFYVIKAGEFKAVKSMMLLK